MQTLDTPTRSKSSHQFGGETFTSLDQVKKRAREIRERHAGQPEIPRNSPDFAFVEALLQRHVDPAKRRSIARLFVAPSPDHGTMCFYVEREDGSTSDFGVGACLQSVWQLNLGSLRELVRGQIKDFKTRRMAGAETFVSDWSGTTFPACEACVDHEPTFLHVVFDFFATRTVDPTQELLTNGVDNCSVPVWKDPALAKDFQEFHAKTGLRLVAVSENLSAIKKAQRRAKGLPHA